MVRKKERNDGREIERERESRERKKKRKEEKRREKTRKKKWWSVGRRELVEFRLEERRERRGGLPERVIGWLLFLFFSEKNRKSIEEIVLVSK